MSKFWRMPEMIEKLLDYLDEVSILTIVGVNLLTVEVLQTASRTSDPLCELIQKALGFGQSQTFQQQREKVQRMSNTLLARLDNPEPLLLEVLDVICAEHKYGNRRIRDSGFRIHQGIDNATNYNQESVIRISCPLHNDHLVSPLGFILLEDCEAALAISSTKQPVIKIELNGKEDMADTQRHWPYYRNNMRDTLLLALVSRAARQEVAVESLAWHSDTFEINNNNNNVPANMVVVFNDLLQRCDQLLNLKTVRVRGELGVGGWETLALAMKKHPCRLVFYTSRGWMLEARREHLRAIWEALPVRPSGSAPSCWTVEGRVSTNKRFKKGCKGPKAEEESEETWKELQEFLDHPEPEEVDNRLRSRREIS